MDGVVVHAVGGERRQFEKRRARIDERHHPLARQKFSARQVTFTGLGRAAYGRLGALRLKLRDQRAHGGLIGAEFLRSNVGGCFDDSHESLPLGGIPLRYAGQRNR